MQVPCVLLILFLYSSIHPSVHPSIMVCPCAMAYRHPPRVHVLKETHQGQSSPRTELAHRIGVDWPKMRAMLATCTM